MTRPFTLTVDSGEWDEPPPRHYSTFAAAIRAFRALDPHYQRFAWITQQVAAAPDGYIVRMRDGQPVR